MFNYVDLIVLGVFLLSTLIGVSRGFTREFFGIIAWLEAFTATILGVVWARPYVQVAISNPLIADVVSGLFIFVTTLFLLGSLSRYISQRVKGSLLGGLDRSLGLLFGLARACAVLFIAYFAGSVVWKPVKWPREVKEARSLPYIIQGADWVKDMIPKEALKNLGSKNDSKEEKVAVMDSMDNIVLALSRPSVTNQKSSSNKSQGYKGEQRKELDQLVSEDDE